MSDIQIASEKVAAIVEAAERAAEELRTTTEQRARERIAEADRAAAAARRRRRRRGRARSWAPLTSRPRR